MCGSSCAFGRVPNQLLISVGNEPMLETACLCIHIYMCTKATVKISGKPKAHASCIRTRPVAMIQSPCMSCNLFADVPPIFEHPGVGRPAELPLSETSADFRGV